MRLLERPGLRVTSGLFSADGRWIAFAESYENERRLMVAGFLGETAIPPEQWI